MTTDAKNASLRELYLQANRLTGEGERESFLDEACENQPQLRSRLERLLAARWQDPGEELLEKAAASMEIDRHILRGDFLAGDFLDSGDRGDDETCAWEGNRASGPTFPKQTLESAFDISDHPMIGQFKLLEEIGHGGMGTVFMARQVEPVRRDVALKVIKPGMDTREVIARFEAERQALAMMDHPNIAKVFDGGTTDQGRPYFVMELVRGVTLTEFCKQKKLSLRDRLGLLVDVCKAVQHAHQKGIIHRDLKPSNLLVTMHDHLPIVKVIDFGVAKALNQELTDNTLFTQFAQLIGTPLYMAPEQAQMSGLDIDTRSDIYSLGVILYELLTGTTPFDRDTLSKLGADGFRKLLSEQNPERPSFRISTLKAKNQTTIEDQRQLDVEGIAKQLKRELDWIVMKALEKDRERRYETANAFAADVQRYLDGEPVEACPPSVLYRMNKYVSKHIGLLTTAALLIAILVSSTAVSGVFAFQANDAKEEAVDARRLADKRLEQSRLDFDRALTSIDTIVEEVSSAEFAQLPGVAKVRSEILAKMMDFYEEIIKEHDNDPYARMQRAMAHLKIGRLRGFTDRELQVDELNTAIELLESLIQEFPDEYVYQERLVEVLFARSHAQGRSKEQRLADAERILAIDLKGVELGREHGILATPLNYFKVAEKLPAGSKRAEELIDMCLEFADRHDLPPPAGAYALLARRAIRSGNHQQAIEPLQKCINGFLRLPDDPNHRTGYIERWLATYHQRELAKVHVTLGNLKDAEQAFRDAHTASAELFLEYSTIPHLQKVHAEATRALIDFLRDTGKLIEARQLTSQFPRIFKNSSAPSPKLHYIYAELLLNSDDPVSSLTEAIEEFPENWAYLYQRGIVYRQRGELDRAIRDANRSVELAKEVPDVYLARAYTYLGLKDVEKAKADLDRFVSLSNESPHSLFVRGQIYLERLNDDHNALADFDRSLTQAPNQAYRYKWRALAHFHLGRFDDALADIETSLHIDKDYGSALWWIPDQEEAKRFSQPFQEGLLAIADRAVERNDTPYLRVSRAKLLDALQFDERARADFEFALESAPDKEYSYTFFLSFLLDRARWQEALHVVEDLNPRRPSQYYSRYQEALLNLQLGDRERYQALCQQTLQGWSPSSANRNGNANHFTVWTCALAPHALVDYSPAVELARHDLSSEPNAQRRLNDLGAILMRAGKYDEAEKQLEKALEASETGSISRSYILYVLAMTEHHLGNTDLARDHLSKANETSEQELANSPAWNRRMTLDLLREEAESLIKSRAQPSDGDGA